MPKAKGHWPEGKRRNAATKHWTTTLTALQSLLELHWQRGVVSQSALADHLGVDKKTIGRWIDGTDLPDQAHQDAVKKWVEKASREGRK